ncbi:MAG: hypothetical protein KatS3mg129_1955 [Leptospiraceae bacterium]|nr:MAG: hypothetical protein KatS3mg129_1955 [Leptospiraceae bacterium]
MKKLQIFYVFMILTILNYESLYAYAKSVGFYLEIRGGNGLSYSGSEYNNIKNLNKNLTFPDIINQYNVLNYGSLEQKIQYFYFYSNVKKPELNTKTLDLSLGNLGGLKLEWNRENQTITGLRDNFLSEWIMINSFLYDGQYSSDINSIFQKNYPYILLSVLDTSKTIKEQINSLNLYFYIFSGKVFRSFYLYPRLGIGLVLLQVWKVEFFD